MHSSDRQIVGRHPFLFPRWLEAEMQGPVAIALCSVWLTVAYQVYLMNDAYELSWLQCPILCGALLTLLLTAGKQQPIAVGWFETIVIMVLQFVTVVVLLKFGPRLPSTLCIGLALIEFIVIGSARQEVVDPPRR
jgi:hypothetical protein